jgi:hypothetical protein
MIHGTFDIECHDWTTFVVGGLFTKGQFEYFRDEEAYFQRLINFEGTLAGHNAGHYDTLWMFHQCETHGIHKFRASLQGSRLLRFRVAKLELVDSFALVPMSLRKAAGIVGKEKGEFDYNLIHPNMSAELFRKLVSYLEKDCQILWNILQYLSAFSKRHTIDLKATIGASAWNTAARELGIKLETWPRTDTWKFARKGYYGGRVEVYRTQSNSGYRYDRNSSYPAALVETPLPVGAKGHFGAKKAQTAYRWGREGIYSAIVRVPEVPYPPLPTRVKDVHGAERLIFPVGEFAGYWAGNELRYAESQGVEVRHISGGVVWKDAAPVLAPWCQRMWTLRHEAETPGLGRWLKWLMNSLTGKLGERADKEILCQPKLGELPKACDGGLKNRHELGPCPANYCCNHRCIGACNGLKPLSKALNLWKKQVWYLPKNSFPHWAAYLTASARIALHQQLLEAGNEAVYCDTDSVYSTKEIKAGIGSGLGEWKLEGTFEGWEALAPKLYRYKSDGTVCVRGKGFPGLSDEGFRQLQTGETVDLGERPNTLKLGLSSGDGIWSKRRVQKTVHLIDGLVGARGLLNDGATCPLTVEEFSYRMKGKRP